MKKLSIIAIAFLVVALVLTSCATKSQAGGILVSWYDGTKLLKEEYVPAGSKLQSWTPEKEGATFMAWYAEASKTQLFDFDTPITEETDLFAGYKGAFIVDDTTWCLIGSGAGTLKDSQWHEDEATESQFELHRLATAEDKNIFYIDNVVLYEGDQFQVRVKGTWTGQHGVGYLKDYTELAVADGDIVGEVLVDGERWFYANGGFGESPKGWNVNVAKSGIYTIYIETNPGSNDYDVMWLERIGDAQEIEITNDMYVVGTVFDWAPTDEGKMETDAVREDFSLTINITEDDYADWTADNPVFGTACAAIKVLNNINGTWYGVSGQTADQTEWTLTPAGQDNLLLPAGQYNIDYNASTDTAKVTVSKRGIFLAGVIDGADHWDCSATNYQFEHVGTDTYTVYYTFTPEDTASWIRDQGHKGAIKATFGFGGCPADLWFGRQGDGENLMIDDYGLYEITLHITADNEGYIEAKKLEGYFLVGTLGDGDTWRAESRYQFPDPNDVVVTVKWNAPDPASWLGSDVAAIKIIYVDADGYVTWYGDANGENVMIHELGEYEIRLKDGVVTATK